MICWILCVHAPTEILLSLITAGNEESSLSMAICRHSCMLPSACDISNASKSLMMSAGDHAGDRTTSEASAIASCAVTGLLDAM